MIRSSLPSKQLRKLEESRITLEIWELTRLAYFFQLPALSARSCSFVVLGATGDSPAERLIATELSSMGQTSMDYTGIKTGAVKAIAE